MAHSLLSCSFGSAERPHHCIGYYCFCSPWSSSRAMWTSALFLVLFIRVWSLSWQAFKLASVLLDGPSSLSFSQYQAQPCSSHTTTPSSARHRPMHSSAFPWQLQSEIKRQCIRNILDDGKQKSLSRNKVRNRNEGALHETTILIISLIYSTVWLALKNGRIQIGCEKSSNHRKYK